VTEVVAARAQTDGPLGLLCSSWRDVQQTRLALQQRRMTGPAEAMLKVEDSLGRAIGKELRKHPIWPWLEQFPGLRGVHTARLISIIGDPRRFPGYGCTEGHAFAPDYSIGGPCPIVHKDESPCPGTVFARPGSGVRSLWHYLGLHVVDGRSPRKAKGRQADWHMEGRSAVLMPSGIADQIVRSSVDPYVSLYRAKKARLAERAAPRCETEMQDGPHADPVDAIEIRRGERAQVANTGEIDSVGGLRPFQIDAIARKVAAKAFVGDLLIAWKQMTSESQEKAA
jgi:hypothetical protein